MHSIDLAALLLRLAVGLTFVAHGSQKAFGWWGGPGPRGWRGAIAAMGFRPVWLFTWLSILAELVAGLLFAAGFLTPAMAGILVAQSVVIVFRVHWSKGFFSQKGGFEYPLLLAVVAVAVAIMGPGQISLDRAIGLAPDAAIRGALLAIGAIGGFVALGISMLGRNTQPAPAG
jgi:putative oxidoreductase